MLLRTPRRFLAANVGSNNIAMKQAESILAKFEYQEKILVQNRLTIADLFKPNQRCGIYVLHFSNDEYYIGQAVDFVRRYSQHCKNHSDIEYVSFKTFKPHELNDFEKQFVREFERNEIKLRNILLTSVVNGDTDLDLIINTENQNKWLEDNSFQNFEGKRFNNEKVRLQYNKNYLEISSSPIYQRIENVLREYIKIGIPFPKQTEYSFWCVTIPNYAKKNKLIRININKQEVFSFRISEEENIITFHHAISPLVDNFGLNLKELVKTLNFFFLDYTYEPGGQDQIGIGIELEDFEKYIGLEFVKESIRMFNLRLMRKGPNFYNHYHCFALTDKILEE